jgi:RHS repeat-associated protein
VQDSASWDHRHQFTGRENDGTGLYFYRARYYSPTFQRFIAQDPMDFTLAGGANLYAYVRNSPLNLIDKLGLTPCNSNCQEQALHNLETCLAVTFGAIGLTEDIAVAGCVAFGGPMALPCALTVIGVYEPPTLAAIGGCFSNYSSGCQ